MPVSANAKEFQPQQHSLSDKDFAFICQLVYDNCGIVLNERKREMVYRRLMRRTRTLGLSSYSEYCQLLKTDSHNEFPKFINAITTNLTSFFREPHHFHYLKDTFLPTLINHEPNNSNKKSLRIWSSACSTGEEPYSIAITLMQAMGSMLANWDARILATDLDSDVLDIAKKGIYKNDRIDELDQQTRDRWFHKGSGKNSGFIKIDSHLSQLITFKQLNLLKPWPMRGQFDVIFCRNVLIYFDKETQEKLILRYHKLLKPGGILFLGHSENIAKNNNLFDFFGKTTFKKSFSKKESLS